METGDFFWLILMSIILFVPFAWIYLILYTLNWSERKHLLSDSWIVFITWIFSSLATLFFILLVEFIFFRSTYSRSYFLFFPLVLIVNIFSIAAILKIKESKKDISILADSSEEIEKKNVENIWKTSIIISLLTFAMCASLTMFIADIMTKLEKPKTNPQFGIYD